MNKVNEGGRKLRQGAQTRLKAIRKGNMTPEKKNFEPSKRSFLINI